VRAAVLSEPGRVDLVERPPGTVGPGQVRLQIDQCGLCASEVDLWLGKDLNKLPADIGHEIAGVITETAVDVSAPSVGDRVAAWIHQGGFADYVIAEARHCVPVADGVDYPSVAEPLACVVNAVELAAPSLGDDVVIIGAGYMGSLLQLVAALKGPRTITVADVRSDALERAAALGATHVVDTESESLSDVVAEVTSGKGADVTFEVTGVNQGLELAGEVTRMSGKLCIVGYHQGGTRTIPLGNWNWMAFQIVNAHFREIETIMAGMRAGMRLVNAGVLDVSPLVTNVYPLSNIGEAFETAAAKPERFVKAMVDLTAS
jgi:threonine dehydrogenase-like Zn-dependent dehydrogenase